MRSRHILKNQKGYNNTRTDSYQVQHLDGHMPPTTSPEREINLGQVYAEFCLVHEYDAARSAAPIPDASLTLILTQEINLYYISSLCTILSSRRIRCCKERSTNPRPLLHYLESNCGGNFIAQDLIHSFVQILPED